MVTGYTRLASRSQAGGTCTQYRQVPSNACVSRGVGAIVTGSRSPDFPDESQATGAGIANTALPDTSDNATEPSSSSVGVRDPGSSRQTQPFDDGMVFRMRFSLIPPDSTSYCRSIPGLTSR
ncbi:hypothetical protein NS206_05800 [Microbacterium testaceum]|nr:hypothetical protein NS206_05800 [Microbacterium testaceum]